MTDQTTASSLDEPRRERRILAAISLAFIGVNAALFSLSVPTASLIEADSLTYYTMALQLLDTGAFQESTRQPLFPLLMAGTIALSKSSGLSLLIGVQLALLYATGLVAWRVARAWIPGSAATAVFGLVILNPNAIGVAHTPLADTLHALLFTVAVWSLLSWGSRGGIWYALACGAALGLAALTRPETKFLLYVLPIAIILVALAAGRRRAWLTGVPAGLAALAVGLMVTLPWMLHNQAIGMGLVLTNGGKASENIRGHFALVEEERTGTPQNAVIDRFRSEEPTLLRVVGLEEAPINKTRSFLFRHYLGEILDTEFSVLARLYAKAWVAQFASGGAQTLNQLLNIRLERADKFINRPGAPQIFLESLRDQPLPGILVTALGIGFAIVARLFGLVGLATMALKRHWPLLIVVVSVLAFKATIHLFYGIARYRLPTEPLLMILAVYGWQGLYVALSPRRSYSA